MGGLRSIFGLWGFEIKDFEIGGGSFEARAIALRNASVDSHTRLVGCV